MSLAIDRFELRAFGPFTGTVLEFPGAPGSLHIICGPNEVGKSTAQRALGDFLFGIPLRSADNQVHAHAEMRLGAVLLDADGRRHTLVRRKGSRSTLLDSENAPVDEGVLESMLGGMTREAFEAMFSITHASLVSGGRSLLAAGGEVGESLFSASIGAGNLHRVREQLGEEAGALFRPRAHTTQIMQVKARLDAAESQLRESTLRATTFAETERDLAGTAQARAAVAQRLAAARAEQSARSRIRALIPLVAERERIRQECAQLSGVPRLPADAGRRRAVATDQLAGARRRAAQADQRIAELTEQIAAFSAGGGLLEREQAIKELLSRTEAVREGRADLDRQVAKLELAGSLAERALADTGADVELDQASALLLAPGQRERVEAALEARAELRGRLAQAERDASDAERRAAELATELERTPRPADPSALRVSLSAALGEGPLEQQLRGVETDLAAAEDALAVTLADLHPRVELDRLRTMACPGSATVERFSAERQELSVRATRLLERRRQLDEVRRQLAEDRARLSLDRDVPTLEDLAHARSRRDRDWTRIRQRLEGDLTVAAAPERVERGIQLADALADTLRENAGFMAQAAELDVRDERLGAEFAALMRDEETVGAERGAHEDAWRQAWSPAGVAPLGPSEMAHWLRVRATVLERSLAVGTLRRSVESLRARRDQHRSALAGLLTQLGVAAAQDATLAQLMTTAQATAESAGARQAAITELARDLAAAEHTAVRQRASARTFETELETWQAGWSGLLEACGWPVDLAADDARRMLATLEELSVQLRDRQQLDQRVEGIRRRITAFERDAGEVIAGLAPDLTAWPRLDAVAELGRRLEDAVAGRNRRRELEIARTAAEADRAAARQTIDAATGELAQLMAAAGVDSVAALAPVEEQAARMAQLSARLPELERQITASGRASLSELVADTVGVDIDALDAASGSAEDAIGELDAELRELDERLGQLRADRQAMERAGGAAEASQAVEQHTAELRELVERYLRVHVAAWALTEAIDEYRREHKDPLLRRADELFPQLTCGSFSGLEADFGADDEPVLIGVRPNAERVRVEQMSTGTREQLYLALRLASLERHVELHGPMPVVLDDVVLHSDPWRTTAILRALADLGRRTQVIAFSHDPQIVALAQAHLDPALITIHELGSREIPEALHPAVGIADVSPIRRTEAA